LVLVSICAVVVGLVPAMPTQAALSAPSAPTNVIAVAGDSMVVATSLLGTSSASEASSPVRPVAAPPVLTPPSPPTDVHATAGDASARVTWFAPNDTGTGPVLGYTVTAHPGGHTCGDLVLTDLSCTVYGLDNGTSYTFTVTATNAVGTSDASEPSNSVTPRADPTPPGRPGPVPKVTTRAGNHLARVSWTAADPNGAPVGSYTITARPGAHTMVVGSTARSVNLRHLVNGKRYRITVAAANAVGRGPATAGEPVVPAGRPGQATKVRASARVDGAVVRWAAAPPRGAHILRYKVIPSHGKVTTVPGRKHVVRVNGLRSGQRYSFRVVAVNRFGASGRSAASNSIVVR
jgi:titin